MINTIALFFTEEFQANFEPVHLLLGAFMGMTGIFFIAKKMINRRNKK